MSSKIFGFPLSGQLKEAAVRRIISLVFSSRDGDRRTGAEEKTKAEKTKQYALLVEDNPIERIILQRILARAGYTTTAVNDGERAMDAISDWDFDLIVVDLVLPSLSGLDLVKAYQFTSRSGDLAPIIAVAADRSLKAGQNCLRAGAFAFLGKPVNKRDFMRILEDLSNPQAHHHPMIEDV